MSSGDGTLRKWKRKIKNICQVLAPNTKTKKAEGGATLSKWEQKWRKCSKNPGHSRFIPSKSFSVENLLPEYQDDHIYKFVQVASELTVKITVRGLSPDNPCSCTYPVRTAYLSGFIDLRVYPAKWIHHESLKDHDNSLHVKDDKVWHVVIRTNVVFDEYEVKNTEVELFFDDDKSKAEGKVKVLKAHKLLGKNKTSGECMFECQVYDDHVAQLISQKLKCFHTMCLTMKKQKWASSQNMVVTISHPHGGPKYITVGELLALSDEELAPDICLRNAHYNADTCPGSSGGPILLFGPQSEKFYPFDKMQHQGLLDNKTNWGDVIIRKEEQNVELARYHEIEESHRDFNNCTKNPGHPNFIAATALTKEHLPNDFRDDIFYEWLTLTTELTVRLRVFTGSSRPQDDKGFKADPGTRTVATGFVVGVEPAKDTPADSQPTWTLWVKTSLHALFDNEEAKCTFVDLFFDSDDCQMKTVYGKSVFGIFYQTDWCVFECVIDEKGLYDQVQTKTSRWEELYRVLRQRHWSGIIDKVFIVSHPHGRPKRVTIGDLKMWSKPGGRSFKHPWQVGYSTDTCPGSSGAAVWIFGQESSKANWPFNNCHHCEGGLEITELEDGEFKNKKINIGYLCY